MITRKSFFGAIRYLALSATGVFLLWLTFRKQDFQELIGKMQQADLAFIFISVVIGFLAFLIRAYRWNMLVQPMGYRPRLANASYALGIGYFANLAIPRFGEIARCGVLSRAERIPMDKLLGTVITERIIDLAMLAFSMLLLAAVEFSLFTRFMRDKIIVPLLEAPAGSGNPAWRWMAGGIAVLLVVGYLAYRFRKSGAVRKLIRLLKGMSAGLLSVMKMKRIRLFAFHTFLMWFMYFLATYVCFYALDATRHLTAKQGLFILVAGGLGMSAPVQGGIGAYHYIVSQALMLFGVTLADGIVYATLVHTAQLALIVVTGCVSLVLVSPMNAPGVPMVSGASPHAGAPTNPKSETNAQSLP